MNGDTTLGNSNPVAEVGYHIIRSPFRRDGARQRLLGKGTYTEVEVEAILAEHDDMFDDYSELSNLVKEKFENSVLGTDGVRKSGRFHLERRCFYLSQTPEGAIAEAAYYLYYYNGRQVGAVSRSYTILKIEAVGSLLDAREEFDEADLICTHHPISAEAEEWVGSQDGVGLRAPSARLHGVENFAVYQLEKLQSPAIHDDIELTYDQKNPRITGTSRNKIEHNVVIVTLAAR